MSEAENNKRRWTKLISVVKQNVMRSLEGQHYLLDNTNAARPHLHFAFRSKNLQLDCSNGGDQRLVKVYEFDDMALIFPQRVNEEVLCRTKQLAKKTTRNSSSPAGTILGAYREPVAEQMWDGPPSTVLAPRSTAPEPAQRQAVCTQRVRDLAGVQGAFRSRAAALAVTLDS